MMNPEIYGYYTYQNKKMLSKFEVMSLAESINEVQWHYNDDFFLAQDWKSEPTQSLEQLYAARASYLRNNYDYIILMYSGGSDSHNILDTFAKNNIHLDEIVHLINYDGSKDKENFQNNEVFKVAYPRTREYIEKYKLKAKHRVIDYTARAVEFFNEETRFDFVHWLNSFGAPNMHTKAHLFESTVEWKNLVASGKSVCFLWGCDKPWMIERNGRFYIYFMDIIDGAISTREQHTGFFGTTDELFYWAPQYDAAQIIIKQGHIIKNAMSVLYFREFMCSPFIKYKPNTEISVVGYEKNKISYNLGGELLKRIIYPSWNSKDNVMSKSSTGNFLSERDMWFWNRNDNRSAEIFLNGIEHMGQKIKKTWLTDTIEHQGRIFPKRIKKIRSRLYEL